MGSTLTADSIFVRDPFTSEVARNACREVFHRQVSDVNTLLRHAVNGDFATLKDALMTLIDLTQTLRGMHIFMATDNWGHDIWTAKKVNKARKGKQNAWRAMQHVARLKITVGVSSACELFVIGNIKELESSMQQLCVEEGELKAGLEIALGTLVKQCSSILIHHFATSCQKAVADEIRELREVFAAPIHYAKIMDAAEYRLREKRQRRRENRVICPKRTSWVSY